uniref:Zinc finger protein 835 n=1 Tax=Culex pipiens TaxID=7175 RepID=A0A8D8I2B6_CULPI
MIRCCVKNCDTDENVVNCTSVFFVGFPSNDSLRAQWLDVLAGSLRDEHGDAPTKICSCHFAEDAFGKHPVHGYRFLLPDAVPSVFPVSLEALLPEPTVVVGDDLTQLVEGLVEEDELITFQEEEEQEIPPEIIEFDPGEEDGLVEEAPGQIAETIGIEFANGQYYFLQSDDESDGERVESPSKLLGVLPKEDGEGAVVGDLLLEEAVVGQDKEEYEGKTQGAEVADPDVLTELDSLITTSEFVEEHGERVTLKQEGESEYFVDLSPTEEPDTEELMEVDGTAKIKGMKVFKHFCGHCYKGFQYKSGLSKHLLVHNGLKPHKCETCGKSFSQKVNLDIHLRKHTGVEPLRKFSCPVCEKKCIRLSELKQHIKSHWRKQPHACPICTERFRDVTNFYDHIKTVHKDELTLQEAIDMIAQNENAELIVPGEENQKQEEDEAVRGQAQPDAAMLDEGFYTCTVCVRTFRTERLLRKHKRKMHPKVFVCLHCPKQFLYKSLLEKHSRVHTQEKPFFCEYCQASFSQKINLEVHLVKRHNVTVGGGKMLAQKHLPCPHCAKMFDRPSSLNNHLRTHTRERPFACQDCAKTFASNSSLATHIRTHHRGESILINPTKRPPMAVSGSCSSVDDGDVRLIVPEEFIAASGRQEDVVSVLSGEDDNVNVIQYSIQFITPSEQGDDGGGGEGMLS